MTGRSPWAARLVPRPYRDTIVGDAVEEADERFGPDDGRLDGARATPGEPDPRSAAQRPLRGHGRRAWRRRVWLNAYLLRAAAACRWQSIHEPPTTSEGLAMNPFGALPTDFRYAVRSLRRAPAFTLVAVATLAVGIGGVTAMYAVLYGTLMRPLPYDRAHELVVFGTTRRDEAFSAVSRPDLEDVRSSVTTLTDLAVWQPWSVTVSPPNHEPTRVAAASVESGYFTVLGVTPARGRLFDTEDDRPGHAPGVVLSHAFWRTAYGADARVVGTAIELDGESYTIVGVVERGFTDPLAAGATAAAPPLWRASPPDFETTNRSWRSFRALGRLRPSVPTYQAGAELATMSAALSESWPGTNTDVRMVVTPLREHLVGSDRRALLLLGGAVLLVLVVACANVANLLLTRGIARSDEHRLRRTLGGGRLRIVRPLLAENALLAVAGWAAGTGSAVGLIRLLDPWAADLRAIANIHLDGPVLLGSAAISLLVVLSFGLAPAVHSVRAHGAPVQAGRALGAPGSRLRRALVVTETSMAVTLLIGAGLLARSFQSLARVELGVRTEGALVATVTPSSARYPDARSLDEAMAGLVAAAGRVPGIVAVGSVSDLPLTGGVNSGWIVRPDDPPRPDEAPPSALYRTVVGDYFGAAGVDLLAGRAFDARDASDAPSVALVNRAVADALFPGEDPVGRTVQIMGPSREIVGVVSDVREAGPDAAAPMTVYVPFVQETQAWATRSATLFARVDADDPLELAPALRQAIADVDATTALNDLRPMSDVAALAVRAERFRTRLLSVFALLALTLASVGLAGVVAFHVSTRRRELGLRMAIGATGSEVVRLLVGEGIRLAAVGAALGVLGGVLLAVPARRLLFGVGPLDPVVLLGVPSIFLATAALAATVPAVRAARLRPASALRED